MMQPKICPVCGDTFVPTGGRQMTCTKQTCKYEFRAGKKRPSSKPGRPNVRTNSEFVEKVDPLDWAKEAKQKEAKISQRFKPAEPRTFKVDDTGKAIPVPNVAIPVANLPDVPSQQDQPPARDFILPWEMDPRMKDALFKILLAKFGDQITVRELIDEMGAAQ